MKTKLVRPSRRMFLQGSGGFLLAIPTLSSLLPRQARAQAAGPPRYVQWITDHGQYGQYYWPASQHLPTDPATLAGQTFPGVKARPLSAITGRISAVLNEDFDAVRSKMNVIRGLDLLCDKGFHNACVPTTGSWPREDNHIPFFAHSVDSILEQSPKVYPTPVRVPALRLTPGVNSSYKWGSFSWTTQNGKPFKLPCYESTQTALNAVFGTGGSGSPLIDPAVAARVRLTDQVIDDYRRVSGSTRISAADRQQLSHYMDLLADVQNRMKLQAPACTAPQQLTQSDFGILHQNATDIAVAALLCGATRVVAYHCYQGSPSQYDEETFHAWAHDNASLHSGMAIWRHRQLARFLRTMDAFTDTNGNTLLDNSVVYVGNELSDPGHGATHLLNMPVLTVGSAGGKLTTGYYIDYGKRLLNNLLVTLLAAMGLGPADYERNAVEGFGDYVGRKSPDYAAYLTTVEKRSPLPFLYRG